MDKSLIQIFRGDDTDGLGYQSIQGKITTTLDLTGCRAVFRYLGFTQEFDPIPENGRITITMPASATSKFPPGLGYASLRVYDSEGKVRTFTNRIPVFVTVYAPSECGGEFEVVFNGGNLELEPLKIKSVNGYRIYDGYLEQIIDKATAAEYGLALLFDSGDLGKDANSGYAATPKAVQAAYDAIIGELTDNYYNAEETEEAIDRIAAYYITSDAQGNPFATYAALAGATAFYSGGRLRTPTRNDYCVVLADETHGGEQYRYIYSVNQQGAGQWEAQYAVGGSVELDNTVTRTSGNGVKSSGIWSAIWGALTAVPGFSSLYDWCVAQLAGKASTADAILAPIYSDTATFSAWTFSDVSDGITDIQQPVFIPSEGEPSWTVIFDYADQTRSAATFVADKNATNITFAYEDEGLNLHLTATSTRTDLGYQLGSQSDKPLQPKGDYAPATGIAKSALAQNVQASLDKADSALQPTGGTVSGDLVFYIATRGIEWGADLKLSKYGLRIPDLPDAFGISWPNLWNLTANDTLALVSQIPSVPVKSVKLNGAALTPDTNGAVNIPALPLAGGTMTGSLHVNGSLDVDLTENGITASVFKVSASSAMGAYFIYYDGSLSNKFLYLHDIATLASPAFTGTPTAPTPTEQSADTQIATKKYVDDAVAGGGGGNLDYVMRVDPETGGIYYTTPDTNA